MERAIGGTERRRQKQQAFNEANGIVPRGVQKKIKDIIDGVYHEETGAPAPKAGKLHDPKQLARLIKDTEKQMLDAARDLRFEEAARLRDQLRQLRDQLFVDED